MKGLNHPNIGKTYIYILQWALYLCVSVCIHVCVFCFDICAQMKMFCFE